MPEAAQRRCEAAGAWLRQLKPKLLYLTSGTLVTLYSQWLATQVSVPLLQRNTAKERGFIGPSKARCPTAGGHRPLDAYSGVDKVPLRVPVFNRSLNSANKRHEEEAKALHTRETGPDRLWVRPTRHPTLNRHKASLHL